MFDPKSVKSLINTDLFAETAPPKKDGIETALQYQRLLQRADVNSRADLARFLGVSRARVTQVLKRLPDGGANRLDTPPL